MGRARGTHSAARRACSVPGCAREAESACSFSSGAKRRCGRPLCARHVVVVGEAVRCAEHAGDELLGASQSDSKVRS